MSLQTIEQLTQDFADARHALADKVEALQLELESAKRRKLPSIRVSVNKAAEAYDKLKAAIEAEKELFVKPRTQVIAGVKVGMQQAKPSVEIDDEEAVIKRIREQLPKDQAELLISVKESVAVKAVIDLSEADLKRLGIKYIEGEDRVLIKPTDSDVDKLVTALLRDATDEPTLDAA